MAVSSRILFPLTLLAAAAMVAWVIRRADKVPQTERIGFQDADAPLAMPDSRQPDHRFHILGAWQRARIPVVSRYSAAMGSEFGALTYNAQPFWAMNEKRGGHHTGDDINGIGGMNTDLGDAVFAVADGLVIYAGEPSPGWGNMVVLAHRERDGRPLQTMYAHLHRILVSPGDLVPCGKKIGLVGTANGHYPAHLHLELRESDGVDIGAGYSMWPLNRLNPSAHIAANQPADPASMTPSLLDAVLKSVMREDWTRLEIQGAERLLPVEDE
jgi:murein DD-endopeptidase MepM/ murein hydrolase activator NlpD